MDLDKLLSDEPVTESKETVTTKKSKETVLEESVSTKETVAEKKKTKKKPRGGNNWLKPENMLNVDEGDNSKFIQLNLEIMNLPDIDLHNVGEVQQRLNDYLAIHARYDVKPTVSGMAMSLNGMSRQTLRAIVTDRQTGSAGYKTALPPEVATAIKKAYFFLENLWENYMGQGKINPVSGIFLGKNNYGYVDKQETIITPNTQQDDYSAEDIRERYIGTTTTIALPDSSDSDD